MRSRTLLMVKLAQNKDCTELENSNCSHVSPTDSETSRLSEEISFGLSFNIQDESSIMKAANNISLTDVYPFTEESNDNSIRMKNSYQDKQPTLTSGAESLTDVYPFTEESNDNYNIRMKNSYQDKHPILTSVAESDNFTFLDNSVLDELLYTNVSSFPKPNNNNIKAVNNQNEQLSRCNPERKKIHILENIVLNSVTYNDMHTAVDGLDKPNNESMKVKEMNEQTILSNKDVNNQKVQLSSCNPEIGFIHKKFGSTFNMEDENSTMRPANINVTDVYTFSEESNDNYNIMKNSYHGKQTILPSCAENDNVKFLDSSVLDKTVYTNVPNFPKPFNNNMIAVDNQNVQLSPCNSGRESFHVLNNVTYNDVHKSLDILDKLNNENMNVKAVKEQIMLRNDPVNKNLDIVVSDVDSNSSLDDDLQDTNFDITDYEESSTSDSSGETEDDTEITETSVDKTRRYVPTGPLSEKLKEQKNKNYRNKMFYCNFCDEDVSSRNFVRHLERRHIHEKEIQNILSLPIKSKERQKALAHLRNNSNFNLYLKGTVRPKKQTDDGDVEYYPCIYCKAIYSKRYLNRHVKICMLAKRVTEVNSKVNNVSRSQTDVACALDLTGVISKLDIKEKVFDMMRADEISLVAKKDLLIAHYGESYFKSQKRERKEYTCSNKLREVARLLIAYRNLVNDKSISFQDLIHPENFDKVVLATRHFTGFDQFNKTYKSPSVALHMGTALKVISDELIHLILKRAPGFQCNTSEESSKWRQNVKYFKKLVEARWNTEISSIALKDMNEKRWKKPLLVPLINDVKVFREQTLDYAKDCENQIREHTDTESTYKLLVQCTLSLLILFNRRRIGDVQYLKIDDYNSDRKTNFQDFEAALTESEKILTKQYKRVVNGGKGSRAVVILVPQLLQRFIDLLLSNRKKYISAENKYVFAKPKSKLGWTQGDVAIKNLTYKMNLENPAAISSNRLRKHIATAMQVLSMSKDDCKQFSKFMGHSDKTHDEFYELPIDIYQTSRVVKLLLMMEKGVPVEYKGKSLSEIDLNINEYIEDDNIVEEKTSLVESEDINDDIQKNLGVCNSRDDDLPLNEVRKKVKLSQKHNMESKKRKGWNTKDIDLLEKHFGTFIRKRTYPTNTQIKDFLKTTNMDRSVPVIKSKIQHLTNQKIKKEKN